MTTAQGDTTQPIADWAEGDGDVTGLLEGWRHGDEAALNQLMELIYGELRRLATAYLRRERSDHTLRTSDLVHETYLRLVGQKRTRWQSRAQFFGVAAQMMRRILVNHAHSHLTAKRGRGARKLSLDEAMTVSAERAPELIALDDELRSLAAIDPQQGRIVELRFFGGLTRKEIAQVLGISTATVARKWRMARAWLYHSLTEGDSSAT